jgi:hypothetical protein
VSATPAADAVPMTEAFFTAEKSRMAYRIICARDRVLNAQRLLDQICEEDLALRAEWQAQQEAPAIPAPEGGQQ